MSSLATIALCQNFYTAHENEYCWVDTNTNLISNHSVVQSHLQSSDYYSIIDLSSGVEICDRVRESIEILLRSFSENLWIFVDWYTVDIFKFCNYPFWFSLMALWESLQE